MYDLQQVCFMCMQKIKQKENTLSDHSFMYITKRYTLKN